MTDNAHEITILLSELSGGERKAVDRLMPLVYETLQKIARQKLRSERQNHTLNTTALVHEAYLKLVDQNRVTWQNRAHFFAIAGQAMRRILINYAEKRLAAKRGGGQLLITFDENAVVHETRVEELITLDHILHDLARLSERQARVVELSFFAGLKHEEIAEVLDVSLPTVRRDWRLARAWLTRELRKHFVRI